MLIKRSKRFAEPVQGEEQSPLTSKDLLLEQMKLQRQQIQINHQRQQMRAKEDMAARRSLIQQQRMESEEKQSDQKDQLRARQQENAAAKPDNTSLYKQKAKTVPPVGMPRK